MLGEARVGKTSLSMRFFKNHFDMEEVSTMDASCLDKVIEVQLSKERSIIIVSEIFGQEDTAEFVWLVNSEGSL